MADQPTTAARQLIEYLARHLEGIERAGLEVDAAAACLRSLADQLEAHEKRSIFREEQTCEATGFAEDAIHRIAKLEAQVAALKPDAELGRIAMRFVDRAGDIHPGIDDAEKICAEFYAAMAAPIEARMSAAIDAAKEAKHG